MATRQWLTGLALASVCVAAPAVPPSYDYIELGYVKVNRHDPAYDFEGGAFAISSQLWQYLFFEGGYQYLRSSTFTQGLVQGRLEDQRISAGLGGRVPLVRNRLDFNASVDFLHADLRQQDGFEGVFPDRHDNGVQGRLGLRFNLPYFEAAPELRYVHIFDDHDWVFGVQLLGCPGYGVCLTAGYEYFKDAKDSRFLGGLRFNYD